jgi:hypothetical protein
MSPMPELDTTKVYEDHYGWLWRYCQVCEEWHRWKKKEAL